MYFLRPSEPRTVLLWGDRWYFPKGEASKPFRSVEEAVELLVAHFAEEPKPVRVRLIFQPDTLDMDPVACPQGDRRVLAAALAGDFPALNGDEQAWSYEPILPDGEGFATILYHESQPMLMSLAARLARHAVAVESAWPLATYLHALPDEWSASGGVTVLAVKDDAAIAYHHGRNVPRRVLCWRGASHLEEVTQWLTAFRQSNPEEPLILVVGGDSVAARIEPLLTNEAEGGLEVLSVEEALGRRIVLPRYHPAQLIPPQPVFSAERVAIAASIALILSAALPLTLLARNWTAARSEAQANQARLAELKTQVAHLRENAAEIASARRAVESGAAGPPVADLLRSLSKTTPAEIALSTLRLEEKHFEFAGWIAPTASPEILSRWQKAISKGNPWSLEIRPGANGAFLGTGVFGP